MTVETEDQGEVVLRPTTDDVDPALSFGLALFEVAALDPIPKSDPELGR